MHYSQQISMLNLPIMCFCVKRDWLLAVDYRLSVVGVCLNRGFIGLHRLRGLRFTLEFF